MKTKYLNKWLSALESGEYEQCDGQLGEYGVNDQPDSFCCLGVLCDVLLDFDETPVVLSPRTTYERWDGWVEQTYSMSFNSETGLLPREVAEFLGVKESPDYNFTVSEGDFDDRGAYVELDLATLNDCGFSFSQIADVIRWAEPAE